MFPSAQLASTFPSKQLGTTLFAFDDLSSTNTFALELIRKNPQDGTLIFANRQTDGRGRLDRNWFSPPDRNIYASLIKRLPCITPIQDAGWVPLLAGLAIVQAIEESADQSLVLKWPNDILMREKKLGGILCETATDFEGTRWVVIGFGINVNQAKISLPFELQETVTSLQQESGRQWDRLSLLQGMASSVESIFSDSAFNNLPAWKNAYQARCSTIGQTIQVKFPDGSILTGIAQSIGEQGQLKVCPIPSLAKPQSDRMVDIHAADILHIRRSTST
ncbi:MAG: biotin--[acetyl-CoA-carboxylase] ligase [Nitrospirales bacterium]|nr:biotin--[acetyl-CoA-carboxylase] ligase [Nitrospirales bacterium]